MSHDYFYGAQAERFSFYRVPKVLFTDEQYRSISAEAKILYGIMLDRMSLSRKNGWFDEQGRVYIVFTLENVMETIGCADNKATKLFEELENKAELIERKRQGQGKPTLIYVKSFEQCTETDSDFQKSRFKTRENHDSKIAETTILDSRKSSTSNTNKSETEKSNTEKDTYTPSATATGDRASAKAVKKKYGEYQNVRLTDDELAKLKQEFPLDWNDRIERLSEYIASKGDKYKSHLATIRSWNRMHKEQPGGKTASGIPDDDPYAGYTYRW
jgi:hypothetical protein